MQRKRIEFLAMGAFSPQRVKACWVADTRPRIDEVEQQIEAEWAHVAKVPGLKLFDGPMCRLERFSAGDALELNFSRTSYKTFLGTNLKNPRFGDQFGQAALANPVGMSTALVSCDDLLLLGRRNASVAYYPRRLHPFAGALEPSDALDVFAGARRELQEEIGLEDEEIRDLVCVGLAEDQDLRQPELLFLATSTLTRMQIERQLDTAEHSALVASPIRPQPLLVLAKDPELTPVGMAIVLLLGRQRFGQRWFEEAERAVNLRP